MDNHESCMSTKDLNLAKALVLQCSSLYIHVAINSRNHHEPLKIYYNAAMDSWVGFLNAPLSNDDLRS